MGTNFADGRGNISVAMSTSDRKSALRQDRPWFKKAMQDPDIAGTYFILPFSGMTQTGGNNPTYQALLNSMFPNIPAGSNMLTTGNLYFLGNTPFTAGGIGDIALGAMEQKPPVMRAEDNRGEYMGGRLGEGIDLRLAWTSRVNVSK